MSTDPVPKCVIQCRTKPRCPKIETNCLRYLARNVLPPIMNHVWSYPFKAPVDVVGLKLTDYYEVIDEPMDFGTIKERLKNKFYSSAKACIRDIRLVFSNCYTYNPPDHDVVTMAKELEGIFLKKLKHMPKTERPIEEQQKGKIQKNKQQKSKKAQVPNTKGRRSRPKKKTEEHKQENKKEIPNNIAEPKESNVTIQSESMELNVEASTSNARCLRPRKGGNKKETKSVLALPQRNQSHLRSLMSQNQTKDLQIAMMLYSQSQTTPCASLMGEERGQATIDEEPLQMDLDKNNNSTTDEIREIHEIHQIENNGNDAIDDEIMKDNKNIQEQDTVGDILELDDLPKTKDSIGISKQSGTESEIKEDNEILNNISTEDIIDMEETVELEQIDDFLDIDDIPDINDFLEAQNIQNDKEDGEIRL